MTALRDTLARLKAETADEHRRIEDALALGGDALTADAYRRVLARFLGFYRPLEPALPAVPGLDLADRRKVPLLVVDLRTLGVDPDALPDCAELPPHTTVGSALGVLYVLEGATLGGQVISRHLRQALGVTSETGGRFFHGYGDRTGAMWQTFRTALAAFAADLQTQDEVVAAAIATFQKLRRWYEGDHT